MIFFANKLVTIEGNDTMLANIYNRMYNGNSHIDINVSNSGKINEGLFKVITMHDYTPDTAFNTSGAYSNLGASIRNIQYCIFGDYAHYNGGSAQGNHICGARLAESDEVGIHWTPNSGSASVGCGEQEMRGFIESFSSFGQPVKLVGKGYSNNIASPLWWTDENGDKWEAPMIVHSNFSTSYIDFETQALNMNYDVIGTEAWKKEIVNAPTTGLGTYREVFNDANGLYNQITSAEKDRYRSQIQALKKTRDLNKRFKLDIIEKTSGGFSVGFSTDFQLKTYMTDLYETSWGNNFTNGVFEHKYYSPVGLVQDQSYFTIDGNNNLEPQEYIIPVIFGKISNTSGTFGKTNIGIKYEYDANSKNSIIALAKACVYNNVKNNRGTNQLSVYTFDDGNTYIFSEAIDLRNISTSGAIKGKVVANNGDVVLIAHSNVYITTETQINDYIFPAINIKKN